MPKPNVILNKSSDWHEWIFLVKNKALDADIVNLIDPDLGEEPPILQEPRRPLPSDVKDGAVTLSALSAGDKGLFKLLLGQYKCNFAIYKQKRAGLNHVRNFILSTISRSNLSYILDKETLYQMLAVLKLRIAPTDRARRIEVARLYQDLKKAPRPHQIDAWLRRWEKICTDATRLDLPEVQGSRVLYNFLLAVRTLDPSFASFREIQLDEKISEKKTISTVFGLISKFRNHNRYSNEASPE